MNASYAIFKWLAKSIIVVVKEPTAVITQKRASDEINSKSHSPCKTHAAYTSKRTSTQTAIRIRTHLHTAAEKIYEYTVINKVLNGTV